MPDPVLRSLSRLTNLMFIATSEAVAVIFVIMKGGPEGISYLCRDAQLAQNGEADRTR